MTAPVLLWLRRDLRLDDHPALTAACASGRPVIPVFLRDESVASLGAAPALRLELALAAFVPALEAAGARLILRSGKAALALDALITETGAAALYWTRRYDPDGMATDQAITSALTARGVEVQSFPGALLHEPWNVATGQGRPYQVFTPFWNAIRDRDPGAPLPAPARLPAPEHWPASERLADWHLSAPMNRGGAVVAAHVTAGEVAARDRLEAFAAGRLTDYAARRDFTAEDAPSGLSDALAWGEIGPRRVWARVWQAKEAGNSGAEPFLRQLAWRDFAWHLAYHTPHILSANWRGGWERFPWRTDPDTPELRAWHQGRTGEPFVDAAMRELWVTGHMHNRARMIVASYLTKHLLLHWRLGQAIFEDMLVDWDPANNAMGWQWVAGCGPDAAPYFRVFNPATQAQKFDPEGGYRQRWIAEGQPDPPETARTFFNAVPRRWRLSPAAEYPDRLIDLAAGRARALAAYAARETH